MSRVHPRDAGAILHTEDMFRIRQRLRGGKAVALGNLLDEQARASRLGPTRLVAVPASAAPRVHRAGPSLPGPVADALIRCERSGAPTVFIAAAPADLDSPLAAVCRYIASDRDDVVADARQRFGAGRTFVIETVDFARMRQWAGPLRSAIFQRTPTLRKDDHGVGGLVPIRAVYERMRRRGRAHARGRSRIDQV